MPFLGGTPTEVSVEAVLGVCWHGHRSVRIEEQRGASANIHRLVVVSSLVVLEQHVL